MLDTNIKMLTKFGKQQALRRLIFNNTKKSFSTVMGGQEGSTVSYFID